MSENNSSNEDNPSAVPSDEMKPTSELNADQPQEVNASNDVGVVVSGSLLVIRSPHFQQDAKVAVLTHPQAHAIIRALIAIHGSPDSPASPLKSSSEPFTPDHVGERLAEIRARHRFTTFAYEGDQPPQAQRDIDTLLSIVETLSRASVPALEANNIEAVKEIIGEDVMLRFMGFDSHPAYIALADRIASALQLRGEAERERAAKIAERHDKPHNSGYRCYEGEKIAAAIRAQSSEDVEAGEK